MNHPILILIRGLPGSGKSYIANELEKALAKTYGDGQTVTLDPDATDRDSQAYLDHVKQQTEEGVAPILHPYRFLRAQAYQAITTNKIILWNQPFTNLDSFQKVTARLQEYASEKQAEMPLLVVEVEIDPEIAKQRVDARKKTGGHGPSDKTFERFNNEYTSFASKGYNTVTVHGHHDATKSVATILEAIEKLV